MSAFVLWTVYAHPLDYPQGYVARKFILDEWTPEYVVGATLDEVRARIPKGLIRLTRSPFDEPQIVETWF